MTSNEPHLWFLPGRPVRHIRFPAVRGDLPAHLRRRSGPSVRPVRGGNPGFGLTIAAGFALKDGRYLVSDEPLTLVLSPPGTTATGYDAVAVRVDLGGRKAFLEVARTWTRRGSRGLPGPVPGESPPGGDRPAHGGRDRCADLSHHAGGGLGGRTVHLQLFDLRH